MTATNQRVFDKLEDAVRLLRSDLADLKATVVGRWGRVPHVTADPTSPPNGSMWIRDDLATISYRTGGVTANTRGILALTSTQRAALTTPTLYAGLMVFETDTGTTQQYTGTVWVPVAQTQSQTYTPTLGNVTGGTVTGTYSQVGKIGVVYVNISAGTATAAGFITASLPASWTVTGNQAISAVIPGSTVGAAYVTGNLLRVFGNATGGNFTLGASVITVINASLILT